VDGDGPKTYWTRELNGDELILVSYSNESPLRSDLRGRSEKMKNSINTKAPEFESFTNSNFWPSKTKKKKKNNKKENDHNHKILFWMQRKYVLMAHLSAPLVSSVACSHRDIGCIMMGFKAASALLCLRNSKRNEVWESMKSPWRFNHKGNERSRFPRSWAFIHPVERCERRTTGAPALTLQLYPMYLDWLICAGVSGSKAPRTMCRGAVEDKRTRQTVLRDSTHTFSLLSVLPRYSLLFLQVFIGWMSTRQTLETTI